MGQLGIRFKNAMQAQGQKLMALLMVAVNGRRKQHCESLVRRKSGAREESFHAQRSCERDAADRLDTVRSISETWSNVKVDISGHQQAEARATAAERILNMHPCAIDQAVIVAVTDTQGRITYCNDNFCRISGYGREELLGKNHRVVKSDIHSKNFFRDMYRQVARGEVWRGEVCNKAKDGRLYWVDTTIVPSFGEDGKPSSYTAIRVDITARKTAERLLQDSQAEALQKSLQLEAAVANISQGLCMLDAEQRVVVCNEQYARMYGLSPEDVKPGTTLQEIVERQVANGVYAGDSPDTYISSELTPVTETSSGIQKLRDGRIIAISCRTIADGGWVMTHLDVTERRRAEAENIYMAHHDLLTGLANRTLFLQKLNEAGARLRRRGEPFTVLMLDLDRFKDINDSLGHAAGDELLKELAHRLKSSLRETDVVARLGGDEFAIIQTGEANQQKAAAALAIKIILIASAPFYLGARKVSVGASIGIALAPGDGIQPNELLKMADLALYRTKSKGRNGFSFFQAEMTIEADLRHRLEGELREAISRNEFELHYQPIIDAKTRRMCAVEALVRWRHPANGLILPDRFITLAEETGLIIPLGEWILKQACADAALWPGHIKVAVNISAVQFRKGDLHEIIESALTESRLPPHRLELEITESVLMDADEKYLSMIKWLRKLGITVALDDFGTGYSSLACLMRFPFDKIKIDRSFTQDLYNSTGSMAVVSSVLTLAHGLGIATTAEGVETEDQFEVLRAGGVNMVQGYLFGRRCPASELDFSASQEDWHAGNAA